MFKVSCLLLTIFISSFFSAASAQQSPTKAPDAPDHSKEAFVIEQSSDKFKFENDGSYQREIGTRIRIQSDAGVQHFSVVKFAYQNSTDTFAVDYVRVHKQDGSIVVSPPDSFQDMPADIARAAPFYSDARETHVAVRGLSVGDVLEYLAHWQHNKPLIPGQFWLEYGFAHDGIVLQEQVEVSVPRERAIKLRTPALKPVVTETGRYRMYKWINSNLEDKNDKQ
jgi:hypothetical protein